MAGKSYYWVHVALPCGKVIAELPPAGALESSLPDDYRKMVTAIARRLGYRRFTVKYWNVAAGRYTKHHSFRMEEDATCHRSYPRDPDHSRPNISDTRMLSNIRTAIIKGTPYFYLDEFARWTREEAQALDGLGEKYFAMFEQLLLDNGIHFAEKREFVDSCPDNDSTR